MNLPSMNPPSADQVKAILGVFGQSVAEAAIQEDSRPSHHVMKVAEETPLNSSCFLGYDVERLVESVNEPPRPRARLRGKASLERPRGEGWRLSHSAYRRCPMQR